MDFNRIYFVSNKLQLASTEALIGLEMALNMTLPKGYFEFMEHLGVGTYCDFLRVYPPDRILAEYQTARERWRDDYFWDAGEGILSRDQVLECIIFADSVDSDAVIVHPTNPDKLYVLPRHDDNIYWIPDAFEEPLNWDSTHGKMFEPPAFKHFESWVNRAAISFFTHETDIDIDALMRGIAVHWPDMLIDEMDEADQVRLLFVPSIDGRLQLVQSGEDDIRVGVRLDYDRDFERVVDDFSAWLSGQGFFETWRSKEA